MSFYHEIKNYNWNEIKKQIYAKTQADVERALNKDKINLDDFQALLSPAASDFLEIMAQRSKTLTQERFGKCIQMYIPLYLSNSCTNNCVYCGFKHNNKFNRKILSKQELLCEVEIIKKMGFEHILLVSGEDQKNCNSNYIAEMMDAIKDQFSLISLEVQPLETKEYKALIRKALHTVYIYQETYHESAYEKYHPSGKKSNYRYRLETPDRLGQSGVHKIGLACLLGLEDWRVDSFFTALHLQYLEKKYWKSKYSVSFPRLRPNAGGFQPNCEVSHKNLLQLITAYRLLNQHVEISISTRESEKFRDHILQLGATSFSAGSRTNPGAYSHTPDSLEQFSVNDDRHPTEIEAMIKSNGYEVVWKDWDHFMQL